MKITLKETGGLLGKSKKAVIDFDIPEKEYRALIKKISISSSKENLKAKDAFNYTLLKDSELKGKAISISNIPAKYDSLFDELFKNLKVEK